MPPENQTDSAPAAKVVVERKAHPAAVAWHTGPKLRATALQLVKDLEVKDADPVRLGIAKDTALKLIEAQPPLVNGVDVKIEVNAGSAWQVMAIVTPHNF